MKELLDSIYARIESFTTDSAKCLDGNKAAARRARKTTLELERLFKEFRKVTVEKEK